MLFVFGEGFLVFINSRYLFLKGFEVGFGVVMGIFVWCFFVVGENVFVFCF